MISEFVREQKRYTQKELCHILLLLSKFKSPSKIKDSEI